MKDIFYYFLFLDTTNQKLYCKFNSKLLKVCTVNGANPFIFNEMENIFVYYVQNTGKSNADYQSTGDPEVLFKLYPTRVQENQWIY